MGKLDRLGVARRDDDARADADLVEQPLRKAKGHAHAAMRGRISGQRPAMQRDAVPGDAQHVRHPGIVIEARVVVLVLLHDAKTPAGVSRPFDPARHRRAQDPAVGVVERHLLALDRHDRHDRFAGLARGRRLGGALGTRLTGRGVGGRAAVSAVSAAMAASVTIAGGPQRRTHLDGLRRRESICHAMFRCQRRNRVETNTENGGWSPVLRPVVNQHFHVIRVIPAHVFRGA